MDRKDEDLELMERVKNCDNDAWEALFRKYYERIYRRIHTFLQGRVYPTREEAEDLASETFVRVKTKSCTFRRRLSVVAWIDRIAVNLAIDELRRRRILEIEPLDSQGSEQEGGNKWR